MLELRIHRRIAAVRSAWKRLQQDSAPTTSVYQSYFVNAIVKRRMPIYARQENYVPKYLELREDGKTVMIAPVCQYRGSDRYCSLGKFNGFQVYDFIYAQETTHQEMERYLRFIMDELKSTSFALCNVPEESALYRCVRNLSQEYSVEITENDNVRIPAGNDYDLWYNGLSKHARQNVRTAYNRMKTDEIEMRCEVYRGQKMDRNLLNRLIDLYCQRHSARYDVQTSSVKKLYLKYLDFSTVCQQSYSDNFYVVLYLNEQVAAFMSGMVEKKGTSVVIPRLSIDEQYSRYSPGVVLINETIKRMTSELNIQTLDLSKGAEGYKLSMGGLLYHTYNITLAEKSSAEVICCTSPQE